jgi:hypothetical protein
MLDVFNEDLVNPPGQSKVEKGMKSPDASRNL